MQKNIEHPKKTVCQWKLEDAEVTSRISDPKKQKLKKLHKPKENEKTVLKNS